MPIPIHSTALPSVQLAAEAANGGVTELRVHGVGGSPPSATLGDLAPEQVTGDATAGFYRTADHCASVADQAGRRDVGRHVEVYSWGGLTSRSKVRVLWLALLPFLFANLAGWMCPAGTRNSTWKFRLHRLAAGLGSLALTVNAALIAVVISADVIGYQTARAGIALHQWWLAPLGWRFIAGQPGRQVMLGVLVPVLFVLALTWLASATWRYEAVRPPYRVSAPRTAKVRMATAAALPDGLADDEFWDGQSSVRLITWVHVAVTGGFLAVVLGVTTRALNAGSPHVAFVGWAAIGLGAATVVLGAGYVAVDALTTPPVDAPGKAPSDAALSDAALSDAALSPGSGGNVLGDGLRVAVTYLRYVAAAALVLAGLFAWVQPAAGYGRVAGLPGMAGLAGWTALAIAVTLAIGLISMLLGLPGGRDTFKGGPWVTLMLGFGLLNILLLGAGIWVAHLVGPVTGDAAEAVLKGHIYLPYLVTAGAPLVAWAAVLAVVAFVLVEGVRWLFSGRLPAAMAREYRDQAAAFRGEQTGARRYWYWSGLNPFGPPGLPGEDDGGGKNWQRQIARVQFLARAPHDASWLLWAIVGGQVIMAGCVWRLHIQPPVLIRNIGVGLAGLAVPALMAFLYSAWNDTTRRRLIGIAWDIGTFWPRSYHPLAPPCYTERAIPELQRRMWWLHDNGGRVMLTAHSQGTVLAAAALVQPGCRPAGDRPALITFGSPLIKLYGWGFPAYFGRELLGRLAPGGSGQLNDWHNFHYPTDPIGGPVAGGLPAACGDPVDIGYLDPAECYYVYGQAPPSAQGHSGYWADPRVWAEINRVAAGLGDGPPDSRRAGGQVAEHLAARRDDHAGAVLARVGDVARDDEPLVHGGVADQVTLAAPGQVIGLASAD
jgi:hypothetical protein